MDLAGNVADTYTSPTFSVDLHAPEINVVNTNVSQEYLQPLAENLELFERVKKCVEGAALMTDTTYKVTVNTMVTGCALIAGFNSFLYESMQKVPPLTYDDEDIAIEFKSERVCGLTLCPEFALMWPDASLVAKPDGSIALLHDHFMYYQLYGERAAKNLGRWNCKVMSDKGTHLLFTVKRADTDWDGVTPMKLKLASELLEVSGKAGHVYEATDEPMVLWSVEADPVITLGKSSVSPGQYGWLMP